MSHRFDFGPDQSSDLLAQLTALQLPGETLFQTAERRLLFEAMDRAGGLQREAAVFLGISPRVLCYRLVPFRSDDD